MEAWEAWEGAWETREEDRPRATSCSVRIFSIKTHGSIPGFPMTAKKRHVAGSKTGGRLWANQGPPRHTHGRMWSHLSGTRLQPAALPGVQGWGWADGRLAGRSLWTRAGPGAKKKPFEWRPVRPGGTDGNSSTPGDSMTWEKLNLCPADPGISGLPGLPAIPGIAGPSGVQPSQLDPTAPDPHSSQSQTRSPALAGPWP